MQQRISHLYNSILRSLTLVSGHLLIKGSVFI